MGSPLIVIFVQYAGVTWVLPDGFVNKHDVDVMGAFRQQGDERGGMQDVWATSG